MNNPLLNFSSLPLYNEIKIEHITPAVDMLLKLSDEVINKILSDNSTPTWENFIQPLDDVSEQMSRAWGQVSHLNSVMNNPELREAYNENLPKLSKYYSELGQNLKLYTKFKELSESEEFKLLSTTRKKIIENELLSFKLSGAELSQAEKIRFLEIKEKLSTLSSQFSDNVLDATNNFSLLVENINELSGIPEDALQAASELATSKNLKGWMFTLKAPSCSPVMQYADNRELREKLYIASSIKASELGDLKLDNTPLITEIVKLRLEKSKILGYSNFAELSLVTKMADTPQQILTFLRDITKYAKPLAEKDLLELKEIAKHHGIDELQSWDVSYLSEKLRQQKYSFSDQEVKQYFPEDAVIAGMFNVVNKIYGLVIKASTTQTWIKDVKFFDVIDNDKIIGQFYVDLYARESKRGGAWMANAISRRRTTLGDIQLPVAYLNCNFTPPVGEKQAVFTHDEVITLFHEFGHGLHHLLTLVEDLSVSGISGVEWDAVELPSQFMENFCWEWDVLNNMTRHVDTGLTLPRELFDKMIAAKNFQIGLQFLRQVELSIFDMRLHSDFDVETSSVLALLDEVRAEVSVFIPPSYNRFANSFSHIFSGGYAAGYYSYKWAEVLSADTYSMFEEHGVLNRDIGDIFRREFLSVGGSRNSMESFKAFRGREPTIDALLKHNALIS